MRKLFSAFFAALAAYAQSVTGSITGFVSDPTGAVVPSARVEAVRTGTNARFETLSGATGQYTFAALPIGIYDINASFQGFKNFEAKGVRLQVNEAVRLDIPLAVGAAADKITIAAEAVTIDTLTATLKTVVDQKRIEDLPLNGRNATQLMRLVAGVQADYRADVTSGTTYPGVTPVSVNGGRANTTNYVLDGAQNNDHYTNAPNPMPNPDALAEFSVQTNNFSAEFGRNLGGVVNAVTRSGTNDLHGVAFEYLRNKAVNAANFFAPVISEGAKKDDGLKRNQFGLTLGGPVYLPKLYNGRDKTFFFFSYQGTTIRTVPSSASVIVPTAKQKAGDFTELLPGKAIRDPFGAAGATFPGNLIPAARISPISSYIVNNWLPTPASGNRITYSAVQNLNDNQWLAKGDHQVSSTHKMSMRFWKSLAAQPGALDPKNYLAAVTIRDWWNTSASFNDTKTISPRLLNSFVFGFNRTIGPATQVRPEKGFNDLGSKIYVDDKKQIYAAASGYFTMNTGDTNTFYRDEFQFSNTLRWTRGRHQFSFGGEYGRAFGDVVNNFRADGRFTFNGSAPFTTDSLADMMIGKFQNFTQGIGEYKNTRFTVASLFVTDSMKLHRRFTLDLGIRWEPYFPYTDSLGKLSAWRAGQRSTRYPNAPIGVLYPGDPGLPDGGYNTTWNNFGPRLGFAWDIFGDGKTSLRGGYGMFFDRQNTLATNAQANQGPFGTVVSLDGNTANSFADPYAGATNPFPAPLNPSREVQFVLPHNATVWEEHMRNPYLQAFNLTLEREIAGGFIARVAYAGSKGTRLTAQREINPAIYAPGATTSTTNQRRALAPLGFGGITLTEPVANSSYHSLQLTAERRFSRGFSVLANYTFAKALDDGSANKNGSGRTNPYNQRFDKGLSDFDHRHVFALSSLYALPINPSDKLARFLIGGWNLTGILTLTSGYPFTVGSGVDNARTGTGGQRAEVISSPYLPGGRPRQDVILQWLNKASFAPNPLNTFGSQGRNIFRGPGIANTDLGLHKTFAITERIKTQFRFEAFNAFNRVNLAGPNGDLSSGNFMRTTSAFDPRILQFALRVSW